MTDLRCRLDTVTQLWKSTVCVRALAGVLSERWAIAAVSTWAPPVSSTVTRSPSLDRHVTDQPRVRHASETGDLQRDAVDQASPMGPQQRRQRVDRLVEHERPVAHGAHGDGVMVRDGCSST